MAQNTIQQAMQGPASEYFATFELFNRLNRQFQPPNRIKSLYVMDGILTFAAYSQRTLVGKLVTNLASGAGSGNAVQKTVRVLWFMREMGAGWLSKEDLCKVGATHWRWMQYILDMACRDGLIDSTPVANSRTRYKINATGLQLLDNAEHWVKDQHTIACHKAAQFRDKYHIPHYSDLIR